MYINLIYLFQFFTPCQLQLQFHANFLMDFSLSLFNAILSIIVLSWSTDFTLPLLFCIIVQYGKEYEFEAPVKLLDKLLHSMPQSPDEQIVVVSQVLSHTHVHMHAHMSAPMATTLLYWSCTLLFFSWKISGRCL